MIEGVPIIGRISILLAEETDGETYYNWYIYIFFFLSNATNLLAINYFTCFF